MLLMSVTHGAMTVPHDCTSSLHTPYAYLCAVFAFMQLYDEGSMCIGVKAACSWTTLLVGTYCMFSRYLCM